MKKIISILLLISIVLFGNYSFAEEKISVSTIPYDKVEAPREGQHHYLLLVTDQWKYQSKAIGNTDGILLLTLDTKAKRIMLTSFSRDILVKKDDDQLTRITFVAKNYSPEKLCEIMSTHFGVKIEKYILMDMSNVENIINFIGGVDITVTNAEAAYLKRYAIAKDATEPSMDKAGTYHFFGHAAVIYMRIRKVGNGDYGRTQRIRNTLSSVAQIAMKYDDKKAFKLLDAILSNVNKTNMSTMDMITAANNALKLRGTDIEQLRIPEDGYHKIITYAGMYVMNIDFERARKSIADFLSDNFLVDE